MATRFRKFASILAMVLVPLTYAILSETYYAHSISPSRVSSIQDYFNRFGDPDRIQHVQSKGRSYYELNHHLPPPYIFTRSSSPPAYVFDEQGEFITWCKDPGDDSVYHETWQSQGDYEIEIASVKKNFSIR